MSDSNPVIEYMKLLRLWNGAIAALGLILGAVVATNIGILIDDAYDIVLGILVVTLFVGAGNSLNDYFDVETDRVAHPDRPLPKGTLSRRTAAYTAAILFAGCIVLSTFLDVLAMRIVIIAVLGMIGYELLLKNQGFAGNAMIALLVFALFEFSGAIVGFAEKTLILATLSGLATLGREIVKDIEDVEGDVTRKTLPKRIGVRNAGYVAIVPTLIAVGLSPLPYLQNQLTILYMIAVLIADALFVLGAFLQLKDPKKGQKIYKVAMIVALAAFAVGVQI